MVVNAHCRAVSTPGAGVSAAIVAPRVHRDQAPAPRWLDACVDQGSVESRPLVRDPL